LEELESLSRSDFAVQAHILSWMKENDPNESGISVVCVSQSPDRFIGQYPHGEWHRFLFDTDNAIQFNFELTLEDYKAAWIYLGAELPFTDCDIDELASISLRNQLTFSDIIISIKETYFYEVSGRGRTMSHIPEINEILIKIANNRSLLMSLGH